MHFRGAIKIVILTIFLAGCVQTGGGVSGGVAIVPTVAETAVLPTVVPTRLPIQATAVPPDTPTPIPTTTPTFTPLPPTATATPTFTPTPVPSPTPSPTVDRRCPDPFPQKPTYDHYYLSPDVLPKPEMADPAPHFWFIKPVPGGGRTIINKTYPYGSDGSNRYLLHNGVDISGEMGMPVMAVADGTVVVAQADQNVSYGWRCDWYGHLVVLELDQTWRDQPIYVLYGHVINLGVEVGEHVQRGQPIAEVGIGGAAIVPHLHLEVRIGTNEFGSTRNPMLWIDPSPSRGLVVGRLVDPEGRPWQGVTVTLIDTREEEPQFINTWSYLGDSQNLINPDEALAENFVFADLLPGEYQLYVKLQGVEYRMPVEVDEEEMTIVEVVTESYKTPTPTPPATETTAGD